MRGAAAPAPIPSSPRWRKNKHAQLYLLDQGINPIAVVLLLIGCAVTWSSTRINAIKALFAMAFFIPLAQQFNVGGLHLHSFGL